MFLETPVTINFQSVSFSLLHNCKNILCPNICIKDYCPHCQLIYKQILNGCDKNERKETKQKTLFEI